MKRRKFLYQSSRYSLGFLGLQAFVSACDSGGGEQLAKGFNNSLHPGYGPLQTDPEGIMNLPQGFTYKVISRRGDQMADGFLVPGMADGMATFQGPDNKVLIVRNHEVSPGDTEEGAFGSDLALLSNLSQEQLYDYGNGTVPCLGGTTTIVYNPDTGEIDHEYLSLVGTIRNCAGGSTPWNSWITCEENTSNAGDVLEKNHGYNFEVPAQTDPRIFDPIPIKAMGRFNHEAVCVDPRTGIIYQTEDRQDGLIYRYLPSRFRKLHAGGTLQILAIKEEKSFDTRNWGAGGNKMEIGRKYEVTWLDIDGIDPQEDDLRFRGYNKGAARFARGEGMWFGQNEAYFACTNGGRRKHGQIFRYIPSEAEGQPGERDQPGTVEIFVEPNNTDLVESADNLTIAANGDLIICEDLRRPRIVGITPMGEIYHFAKNVGYRSEFAGATFSPDGTTLFVNIQGPGITMAIRGPWDQRQEIS